MHGFSSLRAVQLYWAAIGDTDDGRHGQLALPFLVVLRGKGRDDGLRNVTAPLDRIAVGYRGNRGTDGAEQSVVPGPATPRSNMANRVRAAAAIAPIGKLRLPSFLAANH